MENMGDFRKFVYCYYANAMNEHIPWYYSING
jgi:hypothetical protein